MKDQQRCVILYRPSKSRPWELCCIKEHIGQAWRSAKATDIQETILGSSSHKVIVCLEDDYYKGSIKELRPPADFDFNIVNVEVVVEKVAAPKMEPQSGYTLRKCEFCGIDVKNNGAAQFAHLRKHLADAVKSGKFSLEVANAARNLGEIRKLLHGGVS